MTCSGAQASGRCVAAIRADLQLLIANAQSQHCNHPGPAESRSVTKDAGSCNLANINMDTPPRRWLVNVSEATIFYLEDH